MYVELMFMRLIRDVFRGLRIFRKRRNICWGLVGLLILLDKNMKNKPNQYYQAFYKNPSNTKNSKPAVNCYKKEYVFVIFIK